MRASARAFRDDEDGPADDSLLTSGQNNCFVQKKKSHNNNPRTAAKSTFSSRVIHYNCTPSVPNFLIHLVDFKAAEVVRSCAVFLDFVFLS